MAARGPRREQPLLMGIQASRDRRARRAAGVPGAVVALELHPVLPQVEHVRHVPPQELRRRLHTRWEHAREAHLIDEDEHDVWPAVGLPRRPCGLFEVPRSASKLPATTAPLSFRTSRRSIFFSRLVRLAFPPARRCDPEGPASDRTIRSAPMATRPRSPSRWMARSSRYRRPPCRCSSASALRRR